jgi:hypothetical protein
MEIFREFNLEEDLERKEKKERILMTEKEKKLLKLGLEPVKIKKKISKVKNGKKNRKKNRRKR